MNGISGIRRHGGQIALAIPQGRRKEVRETGATRWERPPLKPLFDFSFSIGPQTGNGSLNVSDQLNGQYHATAGSLTVGGIYESHLPALSRWAGHCDQPKRAVYL